MYCNLWFKYCMCHCYTIGQCFAMIKAIVFLNSDTVTHFATTKHFLNDRVFYILQNGSAEYNFKLIFFIHICRQQNIFSKLVPFNGLLSRTVNGVIRQKVKHCLCCHWKYKHSLHVQTHDSYMIMKSSAFTNPWSQKNKFHNIHYSHLNQI